MDITIESLATVAGASAVAIVLTNFAKQLFDLGRTQIRRVALLSGLVLVLGTTAISEWSNLSGGEELPSAISKLVLAAVVGAQAGLAANAGFDAAKTGTDYEVYRSGEGIGEGL